MGLTHPIPTIFTAEAAPEEVPGEEKDTLADAAAAAGQNTGINEHPDSVDENAVNEMLDSFAAEDHDGSREAAEMAIDGSEVPGTAQLPEQKGTGIIELPDPLPRPEPTPAQGNLTILPLLLDQIEAHILFYGRIL